MNEFFLVCYHSPKELGPGLRCTNACGGLDILHDYLCVNCWKGDSETPGEICISSARREVRILRV